MKNYIDLGAETVEFVRTRMEEVLGEEPENINKVEFNVKEVKEQIFRLFYDYQVRRGCPHVAANTANLLGLSEMHVHRMAKNKPTKC
ncbi:MAG: hypothetical protein ACI3Z8_08045 [Paludibacteraceae bacterium]